MEVRHEADVRPQLIILAAALAVSCAAPAAAQVEQAVRLLGLDADDAAALAKGDVVARVPDSADRTEVHAVAAVRVRASSATFAACAADPRCLKGNPDLVELGLFGARPSAADAAGLSLDPRHAGMLERCRVGRCALRLPAEVIAEVRALRWGAATARPAAAEIVRAFLARYATRYLEWGHDGLLVFADRRHPISAAESMRVLATRPFPLLELAPPLAAHVRDPRRAPAPGASYLFWYKERFYRKLLLAVNHVSIGTAAGAHGVTVVAASKQVVATNYLNSKVEVTAFVPGPEGGGIVLYESRARSDIRPSGFTWLERLLLRRLVRGRLGHDLAALRDRLRQRSERESAVALSRAGR